MDVQALRAWGVVASAALIAAALLFAAPPAPQAARAQDAPPPDAAFEIAQAPASAEPLAFIVRFRGQGPIARAQLRAARGQTGPAQREVEAQLRRQAAFSGLCFDRFTVGGAEIVLRTCSAVAANERAAAQQRWVARLRAMRAVEYVDPNAVASPGRSG